MATELVDASKLDACCTAEANAIRAKTGSSAQIAYDWANSKGFADAIAAIPGGSPKPNIDIGVDNTDIPNIMNMFYALEHGTAVTNTFTLAHAIPNSEVEIFDTGLATVHGIFIADESQDTLNTANTPENVLFALIFNPTSSGNGDYAITRATTAMAYGTNTAGVNRGFLLRCTWRVASGKLYCTGAYNQNDSYTPFHSSHTYRWVAW